MRRGDTLKVRQSLNYRHGSVVFLNPHGYEIDAAPLKERLNT
jgi:hypothetical protein